MRGSFQLFFHATKINVTLYQLQTILIKVGKNMANEKQKILLTNEQETLLIPLYSKAVESRQTNPIFSDEKAQEILERVEYDFARLKVARKTTIMVCMRAKKLDDYTQVFLTEHPGGLVLHLGCGLDSRCFRVNHGQADWYDLDMPDVIDLRRKFFGETENYHMIASSVTELGWMDQVSSNHRPVLVIAEGLLMYLKEEDVKALFRKLRQAFPGCSIAFDAFSRLTAKSVKQQPSIKSTGAVVHWGIDDPTDIEGWAQGIHFREEWFFNQSDALQKLDTGYRLMFKFAGLFTMANRAHRILYFIL